MIPYILVLISGVAGINVFITLLIGIFSGTVIMLSTGAVDFYALVTRMGGGASGMYETVMVTVLVPHFARS